MVESKKRNEETERKIKFLENCYNKETNTYDIQCKCGRIHKLNIKQVWIINMHRMKCKCGEILIK